MSHGGEGERALHDIFRKSFVRREGLAAPGDDCARMVPPAGSRLQISTDQLIAGVHIDPAARPGQMARKLLRRSLSDLAAAGAQPWAVLWNVAAPYDKGMAWMKRLARAFVEEASLFGMSVVGGDLSNADQVVLSCTVIGLEGRVRTPGRGGARAGHRLLVTGRLGAAVSSGRHLLPEPRLTEGRLLAESYRASAMIDLSDGLSEDLQRMCAASACGAVVELSKLPLARCLRHQEDGWSSALGEGEDYELLVALRPAEAKRALVDPVLTGAGIHEIGRIVGFNGRRGDKRIVWTVDGENMDIRIAGWEHQWK